MDAELREAPRIERTQDPGAPAPSPMATVSHEHSPAPLIPLSPDLVSQSIGAQVTVPPASHGRTACCRPPERRRSVLMLPTLFCIPRGLRARTPDSPTHPFPCRGAYHDHLRRLRVRVTDCPASARLHRARDSGVAAA